MKFLPAFFLTLISLLLSCSHTYQRPDDYQNPIIQIDTEVGSMTFELYEDKVPNAVSHFITLIESDFYKNMIFHGIVSNTLVQGGCPNTKPDAKEKMGSGNAGYFIAEEFHPELTHNQKGILSLLKASEPSTVSSQFIITLDKLPVIDGKHTVIGKLIKGKEILEILESAGSPNGQILREIEFSIKLIRKNNIEYKVIKIDK